MFGGGVTSAGAGSAGGGVTGLLSGAVGNLLSSRVASLLFLLVGGGEETVTESLVVVFLPV